MEYRPIATAAMTPIKAVVHVKPMQLWRKFLPCTLVPIASACHMLCSTNGLLCQAVDFADHTHNNALPDRLAATCFHSCCQLQLQLAIEHSNSNSRSPPSLSVSHKPSHLLGLLRLLRSKTDLCWLLCRNPSACWRSAATPAAYPPTTPTSELF